MNKLKKAAILEKTRWRPLEGIFGVALTLIFLFCYQLAMYQVSCFYHKVHDSSQNCYISAPLYMIYYKNKFQFSTNCQKISCSILSQHGITNKLAHFLKGLRSWEII